MHNVLNDLKPVERNVWKQRLSDCNASILTYYIENVKHVTVYAATQRPETRSRFKG